jgi:hypothetical protein
LWRTDVVWVCFHSDASRIGVPKDFSHLPPQIYSVLVLWSRTGLTPQALPPKYFYWR